MHNGLIPTGSDGSGRLHGHPVFGLLIHEWRQHGAPSAAVRGLHGGGSWALSLALQVCPLALGVQAVVLSVSAAFIVARPLPPGPLAAGAMTSVPHRDGWKPPQPAHGLGVSLLYRGLSAVADVLSW